MIKVAVVDDHQTTLDGLRAVIEKGMDMDVVLATLTAEEVLDYLEAQGPYAIDVLLVDFQRDNCLLI